MSVEDVNAIVHVKTLKVIDYTKVQNWVGGGCDEVWKRRRVLLASLQSSIGQKRIAGLKK